MKSLNQFLTEAKSENKLLKEAKQMSVAYEIAGNHPYDPDVIEMMVYDLEEEGKVSSDDVYEDDDFNIVYVASEKDHKTFKKEFENFAKEAREQGHDVSLKTLKAVEIPEKNIQLAVILDYILRDVKPSSNFSRYKGSASNYKRGKLEYKATSATFKVQDDEMYNSVRIKTDKTLQDLLKQARIDDLKELGKELETEFGAVKNSKM